MKISELKMRTDIPGRKNQDRSTVVRIFEYDMCTLMYKIGQNPDAKCERL